MTKKINPKEATSIAIEKLDMALKSVRYLVEVRSKNKLSFSRASNVAKEIKELIKVLAIYNNETIC